MSSAGAANLVNWSSRYSVGIARLDAQHEGLFELMKKLHAARLKSAENAVLAEIVDDLAAATVSHFATEEGLMLKYGFPGYESHKAEHERLAAVIRGVQEKLRKGGQAVTSEVMTSGQRSLVGHIAYVDKKYSPFLRAAGVT